LLQEAKGDNMADQKELILKIKADLSGASSEIRRLQAELKKLSTESDKSAAKMKQGIQGAIGSANALANAYKKAGAALRGLGKGAEATYQKLASVQGVITGALVKGFNDMAIAEEKLRMQTQALRANPAFGGIQKDFANISNLTGGLVNDFEMVSGVSKAMAFGLDLSNGRLAEMVKGAQRASIAMGTDVAKAFEDLSIAAGRQSRLIADNLGIVMSVEEANQNYAAALGVTTKELTEQQKKTAFLDEMLRKLNTAYSHIDTKGFDTRIQKNTKTIERYIKIAKEGATSILADTISEGEDLGGRIFDLFDKGIFGAHRYWEEQERIRKETIELNRETDEWIKRMEETDKALELGYDSLDEYKGLVDDTTDSISKAKKEQAEFSALVRGVPVPTGVAGPKITLTKKGREKEKKRRLREERQEAREAERAASRRRARMLKIDLLNAEVRQRSQLGILDERRKIEIAYEKDIARETDEIRKQNIALEKEQALANYDAKEEARKNELELHKKHLKEMSEASNQAMENDRMQAQAEAELWAALDKEEADKKKEQQDIDLRQKEWAASQTQAIGADLMKAMIEMDEQMLLMTAANAMTRAGTDMFYDGIKTLWMGTAKNALFPGLGSSATAIGLAEMGIGAGLMATGGAIANAATPSGSEAGAQERNAEAEPEETTIFVQSTLYPDKTTFQKEFKRNGVQIKT